MSEGKNIKIYLKLILIIDDETKSTLIESIVSLNKSLKERFKTFVSRFSELSSIEVIFSKNDFNKLLNSLISLILISAKFLRYNKFDVFFSSNSI